MCGVVENAKRVAIGTSHELVKCIGIAKGKRASNSQMMFV